MHILLTRPEISSQFSKKILVEMGHTVEVAPLLNIVPLAKQKLKGAYGALVFTSQNAVRVFNEIYPNWLSSYGGKVFAVGLRTTKAVISAGFSNVIQSNGDVVGLVSVVTSNMVAGDGVILFPRGRHVAADLEGMLLDRGLKVEPLVIYEAKMAEAMPVAIIKALKECKINCVLFYSARTATTFIELVKQNGIKNLASTTAVVLSESIGKALEGIGWKAIIVASVKTEQALFDCIKGDMNEN